MKYLAALSVFTFAAITAQLGMAEGLSPAAPDGRLDDLVVTDVLSTSAEWQIGDAAVVAFDHSDASQNVTTAENQAAPAMKLVFPF